MSIPFVYLSWTAPNDINVPAALLFVVPRFRISMDCWLALFDEAMENPKRLKVKQWIINFWLTYHEMLLRININFCTTS